MTTKAERRLGLTPAFKRIAFYYLKLGYGRYVPDHPHYDEVIVKELYEFGENPRVEGEHAGGVIVEFYREKQRVKWVEFRCQVTGGGGQDVIKRVK